MKWLKKVATTPLTSIAKVIDSLSSTTNDRTNAPSIHAVNEAINNNWLTIYPIGSIYMSVNNNDPSLIFGGTWQQIKDTFLLACGDTYNAGSTGGAATKSYTPAGTVNGHNLTVDEMPEHRHEVNISNIVKEQTNTNIASGSNYGLNPQGSYSGYTSQVGRGQAHSHGFTGTAASINVMPPYKAVYVWVRTA